MNQIPLSEALGLDDKSVANIVCVLETAEVKSGPKSTYWNCRVSDGPHKAYLNIFGNAPTHFLGKKIVLCGCEVDSWNGRKKLTLGKRGAIQDYVAEFEASPPHAHVIQKPPQNRPATPTNTQPEPTHANAINGQTVGMAVKAAVDIHLKIRGPGAWGEDDAVTVEAIARDIVSISERIQSGESAPF